MSTTWNYDKKFTVNSSICYFLVSTYYLHWTTKIQAITILKNVISKICNLWIFRCGGRTICAGNSFTQMGNFLNFTTFVLYFSRRRIWKCSTDFNTLVLLNAFMTKIVLPRMQQQRKGAIVNLSSVMELMGVPQSSVYCASKVRSLLTQYASLK